ncbi:MAG TPA: FAD-dependent 5-carboxymethylaminomethyl-2-thiouridine(34) oxidoreductase MnmC, partial [Pseudomonadales bacterium]|nr:FAD-dependent 5-carboxymethylaminomethyl-2-thiouridine(34) oxidoreductase MnmC [Pseudomonadales bacterium]
GANPLPIAALRGQITLIPRALVGVTPRCVVCASGYVAPARGEWLCCGASYVRGAGDCQPTRAEDADNLERAHEILAHIDLEKIPQEALRAGVGYRSSTPDRLPIAGAVADAAAFRHDFAALRHNARRPIDRTGSYLPGLYVSTGHGSRGLTSAPLCADAIAASICSEPSPLSRRLQRTISPARFLIRDIIKGRGT